MASIDDIWAELQAEAAPSKARKQAPRLPVSDAARASRAMRREQQQEPAPPEAAPPAAPLASDGSDETLEAWCLPLRRDINRCVLTWCCSAHALRIVSE